MESDVGIETSYAAFSGVRRVAVGPLREVLPVLKQRFDQDASELVLVFEAESGRQIDFDLRGSLEDVLERHAAVPARRHLRHREHRERAADGRRIEKRHHGRQ